MKRLVAAHADPQGWADPEFSRTVIAWQKQHGRHALPWQNTTDPYRIWLSEIMLQQTQVAAVIPYYHRFLQRFPDVRSLADAPVEDVMAHWSGLGYYTRARNLHKCAQRLCVEHGGTFPADTKLLQALPGIGRSTAAAISAFAYGTRAAILDGNVKRVFARIFGIEQYPGEKQVENILWQRAQALLPLREVEAYTQGLMDLGATLCVRSRPSCGTCPFAGQCVAHVTGRVAELPVRKPKKTVPEKYAVMLVISNGEQVLLEQRPPSGIWGGLLSLPELAPSSDQQAQAAAIAQAAARFGAVARCEPLPVFSHGFTHFKLHVAPYRVQLSRRKQMAAESGHVWLDVDSVASAALPAPVKKLLLAMFRETPDLLSAA
jgi:A/G-specific adenine glycosylase